MFRNFICLNVCLMFVFLGLQGCKKTEEVIVSGNTPPPDYTINQSRIDNFINKSYISLLGRQPLEQEFNAGKSVLEQGEFQTSARKNVITDILSKQDFYRREFEITRNDILNGIDEGTITEQILVFEFLLTNQDFAQFFDILEAEIIRLNALKGMFELTNSGSPEVKEIHRVCINNNFYDDLNMGSLNFVIASFQQFFLRNPTQYEQEEGVKMVDGFPGIMLLQSGSSKQDYINFFLNSDDYYEGQVKLAFNRFFFRQPNSEEMTYYKQLYKQNSNYKLFLSTLLSSDEYASN